jgi:hypothetical protein
MRRSLRVIRLCLSALSLLLCAGACVLWVRSYLVGDGFVWKPADAPPYYRAYAGRGVVRIGSGQYAFARPPYFEYFPDPTPTRQTGYRPGTLAHRLSFDFHRGSDSKGMPSTNVIFPLWSAVLTSAVLPALWIRGVRRDRTLRRRASANRCLACGYDLRATPERCPECGAAGPDADAPCATAPASTP